MKKFLLKMAAGLLLIILLGVIWLIAEATMHDFKPPPVSPAELISTAPKGSMPDTLTMLSWNIGYAGLGEEMDFFYDGGTRVRPTKETFLQSEQVIMNFLSLHNDLDIILLQEVDRQSKRSYGSDQPRTIAKVLKDFHCSFALNYQVKRVPVPLQNPMGRVSSGILTAGKITPSSAVRISLPGSFPWPKRLFMLDRCVLLTRYPYHAGKELVVIHLHNSAFDTTGKLRKQELQKIKELLIEEYSIGNYVVAGGDWNMNPPEFQPDRITSDRVFILPETIKEDFMPEGWQWLWDPAVPTNRDVSRSYYQHETGTTIIDFFLLSPNLRKLDVHTKHLAFKASDHHPVFLQIAPARGSD